MPDLWILIRNDATGEFVGGGIADLDREGKGRYIGMDTSLTKLSQAKK